VIYGIAIDQDGQPAKGIILGADRLDVGLAGGSSRVKTNNAGEYRFEHLNWGRYIVYAEDEEVKKRDTHAIAPVRQTIPNLQPLSLRPNTGKQNIRSSSLPRQVS
jgi:hypothetical protein